MTAILLSAFVTCLASLTLGQAMLRLCGATSWSWVAPPLGISLLMVVSVPAIHVPGRCATTTVLVALLALGAGIWCFRDRAQRPPLAAATAVLPVALLVLVPFLANGRAGILGASFNNDMAVHMSFVEAYRSEAVATVTPLWPDYPIGPHAIVALLSTGLGMRVDRAFAGFMVALPLLTAWTALALVRRRSWLLQAGTATIVGMPFLVAAYYGEAAFKEVLQANLVLAFTLLLAGFGPPLGHGRWVPLALLVAGMVSVYSLTGLPWPVALLGLWLAGQGIVRVRRGDVPRLVAELRRALPGVGIAIGVLVLLLVPQLPRLERFVSLRKDLNGTGIRKEDLGNLVGALPGWEAFGVWSNPDFRLPSSSPYTSGMWTGFVLALVVFGVIWSLRRGQWTIPVAAGASMLIWAVSNDSQSPYVAAKALVIASPLLLALAMLPFVDDEPGPSWGIAPPLLLLALFASVGLSDLRALRVSQVGPTDHLQELRSLRPQLAGRPTLFLGHDDFVRWELAGVPVGTPVINMTPQLPIRPQKAWSYGKALDFDTVETDTLNAYEWVITTRDAAGSAPPPELRLVRETPSYALWRRNGRVEARTVLPEEGDGAGAVLDCSSELGQALARGGGEAAVRSAPIAVPAPGVPPGGSVSVQLPLQPGSWELATPYTSPRPVTVTAPGFRAVLPANLDRFGPRWRIGRIRVADDRPVTVTFATTREWHMTPESAIAALTAVVATPLVAERIVPLRRACGRYVDWYRPSAPTRHRDAPVG